MMAGLGQDLRYAARLLGRNPGSSAAAVLVLALGIGANSALFSVFSAALLHPLPFPAPDRLVLVWGSRPQQGRPQIPFSLPNFTDLRDQSSVFEGMGVWALSRATVTGEGEPEQVQSAIVSASFFSVLAVRPVLGRAFVPSEDRPGERVVIVSQGLWQRRFGRATDLTGRTLTLDGESHAVIGVMPADLRFASFPRPTEVWVPLGQDPFRDRKYARGVNSLGVVARLKPGVTLATAQAEVDAIAARLEAEHPDVNAGWRARLVPLREQVVRGFRPALFVLSAAVACVLLIGCANVTSLLLARAAARQREIAIRTALGGRRARLVRQMLTENVLLALLGGGAGLLLAFWAIDLLALIPVGQPDFFVPFGVPRERIGLDGGVLGFTLVLSVAAGVISGLGPALRASRPDLVEALKEGGLRAAAGRRSAVRSGLVIGEVALSLVLLIGAGLLIRSFARLLAVDPGFRPGRVVAMEVNLSPARYAEGPQITGFFDRLLAGVSALPGVAAAGTVEFLPLSGGDGSTGVFLEGRPPQPPDKEIRTHYRSTSPGYFGALGIPVRAGRIFTETDDAEAPRVAVVNETMARLIWPGEDPIGKRVALNFEAMRFRPDGPPIVDIAAGLRGIVGVVADVKHAGLDGDAVPEMYVPASQRPVREMSLVVRTRSESASVAEAVRSVVRSFDKEQPIANVTSLSELLSTSVARPRASLLLLSLLAGLAVVLASIGLYGVLSYSVSRRTREIGIRMALGAQRREVLAMIVGEGFGLAVAGIALGLAGAWGLTRFLSSMLYGVAATDPATFTLTPVLLAAVALLACWIPARRATHLDPMTALREE